MGYMLAGDNAMSPLLGTDGQTEKLPTLTMEELQTLLAKPNTTEVQDDLADLIVAAEVADELIRTKATPVSEISAELSGRLP